jgi:hypothetical protein
MAMDQVNGYLSRKAQDIWEGSLVRFSAAEQVYYLDRPGKDPVGLGKMENEAHMGLMAIIRVEKHERKQAGK